LNESSPFRDLLAVAHRGWSAAFPENTLTAYRNALEAGADLVEMDLRLTADGVPVISHDPDLKRLAGCDLVIAETAWGALSQIRLSHGEGLLSLEAALDALPSDTAVFLDVKTGGAEIVGAARKVLSRGGRTGRTVLGLRHLDQVSLAGGLPVVGMMRCLKEAAAFRAEGAGALRIWEKDLDRPEAAALLASDADIWVTAGCTRPGEVPGYISPSRLRRLRGLGVAAVLTNDPALAKEI